ncbi:MAG TPA: hypothetical protein VD948_10980, partial [Rhodothermales bacterium]|nr:hypothetical protein [Rhodothermales bacterium]
MAKFALVGQFGVVADSLPCVDPWGQVTFHVLRPHSRKARERAMARLKGDPVALAALAIQLKASAKRPAPKPVNGVEVLPADEMAPDMTYGAAIEQALDAGRITALDLIGKDRDLETAVDLVDGWDARDADGKPVECTPENVRELLTSDAQVKPGMVHEGEILGDVLVRHLLTFAREHEQARANVLE